MPFTTFCVTVFTQFFPQKLDSVDWGATPGSTCNRKKGRSGRFSEAVLEAESGTLRVFLEVELWLWWLLIQYSSRLVLALARISHSLCFSARKAGI